MLAYLIWICGRGVSVLTIGGCVVLSNIDRDLLNRCLQGTAEAWEDFVDRFVGLITYVVAEIASSRGMHLTAEQRDDVVSDVFLALVDQDFRTLRKFRGQSSLGTYLVVIARRIAVRKLAELQRKGHAQPLTSQVPVSDDRMERTSISKEEVQSLLSQLPNSEATAIRMFHLEERSYREIGTHIGIPENSVGPLLSQARERMRAMRS